ncbi:MAG TPA: hypothetical protein VFV33_21270, partial [Gemmatimonadaceae bacterium]|nr:hypothetical protein [Gemmatimonadaceae bacterium]
MPFHRPSSQRPRWVAAIVLALSSGVAAADVVDIGPDGPPDIWDEAAVDATATRTAMNVRCMGASWRLAEG